jgi:hypothetical protein
MCALANQVGYWGRLEPFGPRNLFAYEARPEGQRLDLLLAYGPLEGRYYLEKTSWETGWWGWRWSTGTGPWAASG